MLNIGSLWVSSPLCWQRVFTRLRASMQSGQHPIAVCSALAGARSPLRAIAESRGPTQRNLRVVWDLHHRLCAELGLDTVSTIGCEWSLLEDLASRIARRTTSSPILGAQLLAMGGVLSSKIGGTWLAQQGLEIRYANSDELLGTRNSASHVAPSNPQIADLDLRALLSEEHFDATLVARTELQGIDGLAAFLSCHLSAPRIDFDSEQHASDCSMPITAELLRAALDDTSEKGIAAAELRQGGMRL